MRSATSERKGTDGTRPVALITGASHGIGAATAKLFAAEGFDVCINYLSDHAAAAKVVADCEAVGATAIAVAGNVGDREGAVETITAGAGKELATDGIGVNAIRVGTTNTRIHVEGGNPQRPAKIAALTPMGRIAEQEDIAQVALWLASSGSGFVTGTVITVAGGL